MTRVGVFLLGSFISVSAFGRAVPPSQSTARSCPTAAPTAASYTWDFKAEADRIFADIRSDAGQMQMAVDALVTYGHSYEETWQAHANQLVAIKDDVNDIGAKLCRLETIRRAVDPWQQKEIDRIAVTARLLAGNTEAAIHFLNGHRGTLWMPAYGEYVRNLDDESHSLTKSVKEAVTYAGVRKEYQDLARELGMRAPS